MHVELTLTPGTETKAPPVLYSKCMNTTGSSVPLFSLLSVSVPVYRVSPANERGDGRGGRVYLLTGHVRPGEQRLRQLLHQTGALKSRGRDRAGRTGSGHASGKPQQGSGMWILKPAVNHTQTNSTGLLWSHYRGWRWEVQGGIVFNLLKNPEGNNFLTLVAVCAHNHSQNLYDWQVGKHPGSGLGHTCLGILFRTPLGWRNIILYSPVGNSQVDRRRLGWFNKKQPFFFRNGGPASRH